MTEDETCKSIISKYSNQSSASSVPMEDEPMEIGILSGEKVPRHEAHNELMLLTAMNNLQHVIVL